MPANPDAYTYPAGSGILAVAPQNLPRRTAASEEEVTRLRAEVADQLATTALGAAFDAWQAARAPAPDGLVATGAEHQPAATTAPAAPRQGGPEPLAGVPGATVAGAGSPPRYDPLAVALGNASLLGVGHLLSRRWGAAVATIITTAVLLAFVAGFGQPGWFWRVLLFLWWVATVAHGWRSARKLASRPVAAAGGAGAEGGRRRVQRGIAAGAVLVVLAGAVGVAFEGRRIAATAADAHERGDCQAATETLDRLGARHRVVDPYLTRRTSGDEAACALLLAAYAQADTDALAAAGTLAEYLRHESGRWGGATALRVDLLLAAGEDGLDAALDGDQASLAGAFDVLAEALALDPGRAEPVGALLADYLGELPAVDPCQAKANIDWLVDRDASGDELDEAVARARELAPPVILACGDQLLDSDPPGALAAYEALLDGYPDHRLAGDARQGVNAAETLIEEEHVRDLINHSGYCADPSPYRAAPAYRGGGPHPVLTFGPERFRDAVPEDWTAEDHTDAVLILCVEGPEDGRVLQTCQYEGGTFAPGSVVGVDLRAHRYTVEAYELRTGERAFETTVETGSGGCPPVLEWECSAFFPNCPPPLSIRATHSEDQIRSAVQSWVFP